MKILSSNASDNYLKTGTIPRIFVKIEDANLFLGNKILVDGDDSYTDTLKRNGTITSSIAPFGGVAAVSGVEIANLELGNELTFCTQENLDPIGAPGEPVGAGRLISTAEAEYSYGDVRGSATGSFDTPFVTVGQKKLTSNSDTYFYTYRGCLQFEIPAGLTSCEDATLCLYGNQDKSDTDYEIRVIQGTWDTWATDGMFDDFDGHESGDTAYDETEDTDSPALNETWRTYSFSTSSTIPNYIRFNLVGRELIENTAGSKLKLLLLSERDFDGDEPSGDEFVLFNVHNAYLRLRYNTYDLYNKEAIIYLAFCDTDGSDLVTDVDDMQRLWTGVVDDYSINERTLNLSLRQNNFKKNVVIPRDIITRDNYSDAPDYVIDKPIPIIYGDFISNEYHKEGIAYVENEDTSVQYAHRDYVKLYQYDEVNLRFLMANHAIKEIDNAMAIYESGNKVFVLIAGVISAVTDEDNKKIELDQGSTRTKFPYYLVQNAVQPFIAYIPNYVIGGEVENRENAFDSDPTNYTTLVGGGGQPEYWFAQSDSYKPYGIARLHEAGNRYVCFETEIVGGGAYDGNLDVVIYCYRIGGTAEVRDTINQDGYHYVYIDDSKVPGTGSLAFSIFFTNFATVDDVKLKNLSLCAGFNHEIKEAYFSVSGYYATDTTIAAVDTVYEKPSHIIESIGRDYMGLDGDSLNATSFDTLVTDLTDWKFAFQLLERKDASKLIGELAEQCKTSLYWDEDDKLKAIMFDVDTAFPNADDNTPDVPGSLDIFDEAASVTSGAFTTHPILEKGKGVTQFEMFKMGMDETKNDFILHYKKNNATGDYLENLYITNGAGTEGSVNTNITAASLENDQDLTNTGNLKQLTSDCYNDISTTNTWEYEAWAVRDSATANKLLQHFIERLTKNRWKIKFSTGLNAIGIELGDFICVKHHRLQDIFGVPTERIKKWEVIRINHNLDAHNITFEAIEV